LGGIEWYQLLLWVTWREKYLLELWRTLSVALQTVADSLGGGEFLSGTRVVGHRPRPPRLTTWRSDADCCTPRRFNSIMQSFHYKILAIHPSTVLLFCNCVATVVYLVRLCLLSPLLPTLGFHAIPSHHLKLIFSSAVSRNDLKLWWLRPLTPSVPSATYWII